MKKLVLFIICCAGIVLHAQDEQRIQNIKNNLEVLSVTNSGLSENLKLDINVSDVSLPNFLLAVSKVHKVNISIDPSLQSLTIVNNFSNVTVADLMVFLCREYDLDIGFTGNILSVKKYSPPIEKEVEKKALITFDPLNNFISLDIDKIPLERVFRKITDQSGQNLLYNSGMEQMPLSIYLNNAPFEAALKKMAETNNLTYSKSRDGFYLFNEISLPNTPIEGVAQKLPQRRPRAPRGENFYYEVIDSTERILNVDFENVPVANIIRDISYDLGLDLFTATPLQEAGSVSFKAKHIYYDVLLERIFESGTVLSQTNASNVRPVPSAQNRREATVGYQSSSLPMFFTFKKENDVYFFGTAEQLSVRTIEVIQMMHRSVELLGDPMQNTGYGRSAGRTNGGSINYLGGFQNGLQNDRGFGNNQAMNTSRRVNTQSADFGNYENQAEALVNILPDDIKADLDIKIDFELNSFLVSGPAANINRFKKFIGQIDKPVPVILIEVMLIEVKKSATVETGISWGIGDVPTATKGKLFPETDLTLGAKTVNKIIGGFDGFGSFNIGKVVPEFFATIKAMEANGNLKIRSTPKLSTLNGHRANLSIGETTYYVVTNQNFFGSQIPTSSEIRNYQPIDAELAVSIKPLVSGNGQITLDINVIQSDFSGERIEDEAPPGLTSREFSSIIRMQDQDLAVLGGLEEKIKNDSGSGVPLLARIPVIKWLFSKRKREDTMQKLTILIKPTVIY